jgi:Tfp pilus assembly protein PilX
MNIGYVSLRSALRLRQRGFTLIITISLLVLLTLVAIGLLSLSAAQLRTSSQGDAMSRARSHARMALMVALGDLQKTMGPDGRVCATAEQMGVTGPHANWVGVYNSWDLNAGVGTRPAPTFVQWLAGSQNRTTLLQRDSVRSTTSNEVTLVGAGTVGAGNNADFVTAPRVSINQPSGAGQAAWWIADESMKAHVASGSMRNPLINNSQELIAANAGISANAGVLDNLGEIAVNAPQRSSYITHSQLALKNQQSRLLFHDVTTQSLGLPVDVTRRRFKYDFSLFSVLPRQQVENLPLYRADGRINNFVNTVGRITNDNDFRALASNPLSNFGNLSTQPGINMEELWIHANLYRNIQWSGNTPTLTAMTGSENPSSPDFRRRALADPWFNYAKPVFASVQFVLSFVSLPEDANPSKFRMQMQMDALVKVWNPNNVRVVVPPGASYAVQLLSLPFKVQWNITSTQPNPTPQQQSQLGNNTYAMTKGKWSSSTIASNIQVFGHPEFQFLRGNIGGLAQSGTSNGYILEPGECKIFGYDRNINNGGSGDPNVNLSPGWGPGRQLVMVKSEFGARNLNASDMIEFIVTPDVDSIPATSNRTYCNKWIGLRAAGSQASGGNGGLAIGSSNLLTSINFGTPDPTFFPTIRSSQRLSVAQYATAKPFMIFGHYMNVEQPTPGTRDAFPNAARLLTNSAMSLRSFRGTDAAQMTVAQEIWRADPLPLAYDSPLIDINSRDQGRFGGSHSVSLGVTRCAPRQLDLAPPLSLMSLSNSLANGCSDRFAQAAERTAVGLNNLQSDSLTGNFRFEPTDIAFSMVSYAAPQVERAIGNSYASPYLSPARVVGSGPYHVSGVANNPVFDHSYLANAALFDSWFCSSVYDGALIPRTAPYANARRTTAVLTDFFSRSQDDPQAKLFNNRIIPASTWDTARTRLLNGTALHAEAISRMAAHVFLDGAFNVNSTRKQAWMAVLATARNTAKISSNGNRIGVTDRTPVGVSGLVVDGMAGPAGTAAESQQWSGFRAMTDQEIEILAENIVTEVRARGPFLSLADFLNRRPNGSGNAVLMGTVQAAIEAAGLNRAMKSGNRGVNAADFAGLPGASVAGAGGGLARSTGIPGTIMQADVLAPFANELSARGDTFRIRAYGAALDSNQRVMAEAWCEAVVQRVASYVDPLDAAEIPFASLTRPLNRVFGRRFQIISFQWLPRSAV